jgi:TIR domain
MRRGCPVADPKTCGRPGQDRSTGRRPPGTERLRASAHDIISDAEILVPGQDWRATLSEGLKSADVFVILLSAASVTSQFTSMELGTARAYASQIGKPVVIPILIDDIAIPVPIQDIHVLMAKDRNVDHIVLSIERAISVSAGLEAAKEKKEEETARKIEANAATYVEEAINSQRIYERKNNLAGKMWYAIGFVALIIGIGFALLSILFRASQFNWLSLATVVVTNVIVIGFLGACSRYAFSLGKSYISESLKASDRIHVIAFGRFYLRAFGEKANWAELKEVFQHWNIDRSSAFSNLDASQIDPQILSLIGQMAAAFGSRGEKKEK